MHVHMKPMPLPLAAPAQPAKPNKPAGAAAGSDVSALAALAQDRREKSGSRSRRGLPQPKDRSGEDEAAAPQPTVGLAMLLTEMQLNKSA